MALISSGVVGATQPLIRSSGFFVDHVSIAPSCLTGVIDERPLACHRFEPGKQFAIFQRIDLSTAQVDDETFYKTTFLFRNKPPFGQKIQLPSKDVFAFLSFGNSVFFEHGSCYGEASAGYVVVTDAGHGNLHMSYRLTFQLASTRDYPGECGSYGPVNKSFQAAPIAFGQLDPWLGKQMDHINTYNETHLIQVTP